MPLINTGTQTKNLVCLRELQRIAYDLSAKEAESLGIYLNDEPK